MKQIKILLSSVLTLLLITSSNAYAAPHYSDFNGRPGFKDKQPNMNVFKGQTRGGNRYVPDGRNDGKFMSKRNRLGDQNCTKWIASPGCKNILKKGQLRKGKVFERKMLPYAKTFAQERKIGVSIGVPPTSKYSISDEPVIIPSPKKMHDSVHCVNPSNCLDKSTPKFGEQEGEAFSLEINCIDGECKDKDHIYIGENGKAGIFVQDVGPEGKDGFIVQAGKDGFLNEATLYQNGKDGFIVQTGGGLGGKEGEAFNPTSKYSISDEPAFIPKPDGALGPDVVTTLEHGPGVVNDNDSRITFPDDLGPPGIVNDSNSRMLQKQQQTLKFINGEWR